VGHRLKGSYEHIFPVTPKQRTPVTRFTRPILLVIVSLDALRPAGWKQFVLGVVIAVAAASLPNYAVPSLYPWGDEDAQSPPASE
jgi:hypothetical protein